MREYIILYSRGLTYFKDADHKIIHRENNKPAIITSYGTMHYLKNGKYYGNNALFKKRKIL
jgi:hypothetical protein